MGKSPKPLSFLIHPSLVKSDEDRQRLRDLDRQGHRVTVMAPGVSPDFQPLFDGDYVVLCEPDYKGYDLILSPNAWRAFGLHYLDLAIKSARSVKYGSAKVPKKPKKARASKKTVGDDAPTADSEAGERGGGTDIS